MKYITLVCAMLLLQTISFAQRSTDAFKQKVFLLKRFMEKNHYQPRQWNDSNSTMLYNHWLHDLDDDRIYFTKKDIALLEPYRLKASEISTSSPDFFSVFIDLYRKRLHEADSSINAYLTKPIDFSKPDNFHWPAADYAADAKELELRRQHYLKWQIIDNIEDKLEAEEKTVASVSPAEFASLEAEERGRIRKRETNLFEIILQSQADFRTDMEDEFLDALAWCYDPHSNYMNLRAKQQFQALVSAEEFSAGFTLEENEKGDHLIDYLQPGSSAWKSGQLHKGDLLLKVKTNKKEYDVTDLKKEELQSILGESGNLEITIKTAAGEIKNVKLSQEKITDEESVVKSYLLKGEKHSATLIFRAFTARKMKTMPVNRIITAAPMM